MSNFPSDEYTWKWKKQNSLELESGVAIYDLNWHLSCCVAVLWESCWGTFCAWEPYNNSGQQGYCHCYQQGGDKYWCCLVHAQPYWRMSLVVMYQGCLF